MIVKSLNLFFIFLSILLVTFPSVNGLLDLDEGKIEEKYKKSFIFLKNLENSTIFPEIQFLNSTKNLTKNENKKKNSFIIELKEEPLFKYESKVKYVEKFNKNLFKSLVSTHKTKIEREQSVVKNELSKLKINIKKEFKGVFNGLVVEANEDEIERIKKLPQVKEVHPDKEVRILVEDSIVLVNATLVWQMNDSRNNSVTGKGIKIAIIDTGIDYTHPDLGGCFCNSPLNATCNETCKVIGGYDVVNNDTDPMDDHGHGTHVAGIAAANGIIKGVAPEAKLLAYKVLNASGFGNVSSVIAGIERAVNDGADIISMSLGGPGDPDDILSRAVDSAVERGVVVVVAAGNDGPEAESISSPGTSRKAITVGAACRPEQVGVHPYCNNMVAIFSSRGPVRTSNETLEKPDVVAPGVEICSSRSQTLNSNWLTFCLDENHILMSGTSMATPIVSGVAALLKQLHPNWTPDQIKSAIKNNAIDLGLDKNIQGSGLIDAFNATGITPSAIIKPSIVKIKEVPTNVTFIETRKLTIKNLGQTNKNYILSVNFTQQEISAILDREEITLQPGEEKDFNLTVLVNSSSVKERNYYYGELIAVSDSQTIRLPIRILTSDRILIESDLLRNDTTFCWTTRTGSRVACQKCVNCYYNIYFLEAGPPLNLTSGLHNESKKIIVKNPSNFRNVSINVSVRIENPKINLTLNQTNMTILESSDGVFEMIFSLDSSNVKNGAYYGHIYISSDVQNITIPFWFLKYYVLDLNFSENYGYGIIHDKNNIYDTFSVIKQEPITMLLDRNLVDIITIYFSSPEYTIYENPFTNFTILSISTNPFIIVEENINTTGRKSVFINSSKAKNRVKMSIPEFSEEELLRNCSIKLHTIKYNNPDIGITFHLFDNSNTLYYSNVSNNYSLSNSMYCEKGDKIYFFVNYTYGVYNDINFVNSINSLKKITHKYYLNKDVDHIVRCILICQYNGIYTDFYPYISIKTTYEDEIYYTPSPPDIYWNTYILGIFTPLSNHNTTEYELAYSSPFIYVNDTHLELQAFWDGKFPRSSKDYVLFAYNLSKTRTLTHGLNPVFWFGKFENAEDEIRIYPQKKGPGLFLTQDYSIVSGPLSIKVYDEVGNLISVYNRKNQYDLSILLITDPGLYSVVTETFYKIRGKDYRAEVNATFNTSKEDKDPPFIKTLFLMHDGNLSDFFHPKGENILLIDTDPDGGEISSVSVYVKKGVDIWEKIETNKRDGFYRATLPILNLPSDKYTIKIEIVDNSSNILTYTFEYQFKLEAIPNRCGDGICGYGENCTTCPSDCGSCPKDSTDSTYVPTAGYSPPARQFLTTIEETKSINFIYPGSPSVIKINKSDVFGVEEIKIEVNKNVNDVRIIIKNVTKPQTASEPIIPSLGKVYRYVEISKENIKDEDISKVRIKFKVDKNWIVNNNIDEDKIFLQRLTKNGWEKLKTSKLYSHLDKVYYEAEFSGLSIFAIVGEFKIKICTPLEKRCYNNEIQECSSDGSSWKVIEFCQYGCDQKNLTCNPEPSCPICPEPTPWSECVFNVQGRTNYKCDNTTGFKCVPYKEKRVCKEEKRTNLILLITIIIVSSIFAVTLFIKLKGKLSEKKSSDIFETESDIKNTERF
ncbi:MAG: S8 family serine peptidase [Candidatus Aenigmarchaeota archaeon]|nr:S8 family serine peptidase [Candidatus Aenigmarchaeota archaeon]MDW8159894.1 S8 family serine peptidase [Candidatus Aenigmarchaeota archaeon]